MNMQLVNKMAHEAFRAAEQTTQHMIPAAHAAGQMPAAINVIGQFVIGGLNTLAICLGNHVEPATEAEREDYNPLCVLNSEVLLFAALLVNKMAPDYDQKTKGFASEFGPSVVFETLTAYEKLTGKQPDQYLNQNLVKVAREVGAVGAEPFKAFMDRMKGSPEAPTTLN